MFGGSLGFLWSKIDHAWDPDPSVRARNRRFEEKLDLALGDEFRYEPPKRDHEGLVQALIQFALRAGVIAAIAGGLVWFLAVTINAKLDSISMKQDTTHAMLLTHTIAANAMMDRMTRSDLMDERMVALMLAFCLNGAKTESQRVSCAQAAGK